MKPKPYFKFARNPASLKWTKHVYFHLSTVPAAASFNTYNVDMANSTHKHPPSKKKKKVIIYFSIPQWSIFLISLNLA